MTVASIRNVQLANVGYVTKPLTMMMNNHQLIWITATTADNFLAGLMKNATELERTSTLPHVVGPNIQSYDLHHICLALQSCEPTTTVSVIPSCDEKYISMNFGVLVETITLDDGKVIKKYENLRSIDSFKMMNSSLEKLVDILPRHRFGILASVFPNLSSTELKLLQQKGYYPYSYVSGREKFGEKSLPPLNEWRNTLEGNAVTITQENLNHDNVEHSELPNSTRLPRCIPENRLRFSRMRL